MSDPLDLVLAELGRAGYPEGGIERRIVQLIQDRDTHRKNAEEAAAALRCAPHDLEREIAKLMRAAAKAVPLDIEKMSVQELARALGAHVRLCGDLIEALVIRSCSVELDVGFNDGAESMRMHRCSGEMDVRIVQERSIDPFDLEQE